MASKLGTTLLIALSGFFAAPAFAQASGNIEIFDIMAPGERATVTPDWKSINAHPLGTRENPVRGFQPEGQRVYLRRLICPDGAMPAFRRISSLGVGPYTSILDSYEVKCGDVVHVVVMDMYHPKHFECRAVPGFSIRNGCTGSS